MIFAGGLGIFFTVAIIAVIVAIAVPRYSQTAFTVAGAFGAIGVLFMILGVKGGL